MTVHSDGVIMRLNVDFIALEEITQRYRSERIFRLSDGVREEMPEWDPIDVGLQKGIELPLDEIEVMDGLLSYKGRQVILYIKDHGKGIQSALEDMSKRRKFHVAECITLEDMRLKNRFERYVATQNVSGVFTISGVDPVLRHEVAGDVCLQVCINCLKAINYKAFLLSGREVKDSVRNNFSLLEFFETYSTLFKRLPAGLSDNPGSSVYTSDWPDVSRAVRDAAGGACEDCGVVLGMGSSLLHVHHINGVKNDNRRANLQCLCKDCHRKQPNHGHMFMTGEEMRLINRLRREQGKLVPGWESILRRSDLAMMPVLEMARHKGWGAPELSYSPANTTQSKSVLDAAWPERRVGIGSSADRRAVAGWDIKSPGVLLKELVLED